MDAAAHYRHLATLGRDEFLAAAAPGVLVRYRVHGPDPKATGTTTMTIDPSQEPSQELIQTVDDRRLHGRVNPEAIEMELFPLVKKPGASFPDRITIGRTTHNDVVIADPSVSRLHAYVRQADRWVVADAGSKNGSWLGDALLEARREATLPPGAMLRLGDVQLTFYPSADLFDLLGGDHGRQ